VSGAIDHSLKVGEQVTEDFRVAGRRGRARWTVIERAALLDFLLVRGRIAEESAMALRQLKQVLEQVPGKEQGRAE
jgi:hypothetical protein